MADDIAALFRAAPQGRVAGAEFVLVRRLGHPPAKVWAALTTPERLEAWMAVEWLGDGGPLSVGAPFHYRFGNTGMESVGRVLRLEPGRLLEHSWFENVPPGAKIEWKLDSDGMGTRLTLTHRFGGLDDAPRNAAGWTELLRRLEASLAGDDLSAWSPGNWRALRDAYALELGEGATYDARVAYADGRATVTFVRLLRHSPEIVWAVLTEPEAAARWMQADMTIEPRVGGRYGAAFHGMEAVGEGQVTAFEPSRRLAFTWPEPVEITMDPHPDGCRLTLIADVPAGEAGDNAGGWHWHLDALERALLGETVDWEWPRIEALHAIYAATLLKEPA